MPRKSLRWSSVSSAVNRSIAGCRYWCSLACRAFSAEAGRYPAGASPAAVTNASISGTATTAKCMTSRCSGRGCSGRSLGRRRLVAGLERLLHGLRGVGEVEHAQVVLALPRARAVEPGQGLHGGDVRSFLSTYIVVSSGWSKPVWYLSATTRIRYSGFGFVSAVRVVGTGVAEPLRQRALGEPVDRGLGDRCLVVAGDLQRRRRTRRARPALVATAGCRGRRRACLVQAPAAWSRELVTTIAFARPPRLPRDVVVEVVHDDLRRCAEARGVQPANRASCAAGLALVDLTVVGGLCALDELVRSRQYVR